MISYCLASRPIEGGEVEGDQVVSELRSELWEKELKLTDIRLEALGSAHRLEQLQDAMNNMQVCSKFRYSPNFSSCCHVFFFYYWNVLVRLLSTKQRIKEWKMSRIPKREKNCHAEVVIYFRTQTMINVRKSVLIILCCCKNLVSYIFWTSRGQ